MHWHQSRGVRLPVLLLCQHTAVHSPNFYLPVLQGTMLLDDQIAEVVY